MTFTDPCGESWVEIFKSQECNMVIIRTFFGNTSIKYLTGQEKDLENEDDDSDYDDGKERTTFQTTADKKSALICQLSI